MAFWHFGKKQEDHTEEFFNEPMLVGSDLGYGQVKITSNKGNEKFLSAVGTPVSNFGRVAAVVNKQELLDGLSITLNGQQYYIGRNAIVNTRNGRLTLRQNKSDHEHNKVKFLTSLALLTDQYQQEATFDIVTGLPVLEFKSELESLTAMMKNGNKPFIFDMHYGNEVVQKKISINNVKVISQGEGAFYNFILDINGNIIENKASIVNGTVMVVDIGYRTTDIVTMENGSYIEPLSDQLNKGVNSIHQEILRLIMERYSIKKELRDMDSIVRTGKFYHNKKDYDVNQIINDAARPFAEDIVESLHTISNDQLGGVNHVIFTGGGAEIIYAFALKLLMNTVESSIMENSEFCNSLGYYKYGLLLQKAEKDNQ